MSHDLESEAEESVVRFLESYKSAVFSKDVEAFVSLYHPDARIFDFWAEWSYDGIDEWREMVVKWFESLGDDHDSVEFSEVQSLVTDEVAVVHAFVRFAAISPAGDELRGMDERLTWTLVRLEGELTILHQHTSAPIDFDTMKPRLQRG